MARKKRLKFNDIKTFYHVFSKTVGSEFLLNTNEKKKFFIDTLKRLSIFFSIKVKHFVVMTNHLHLILETCPEIKISDEELIQKAKKAKLFKNLVLKKDFIKLRKKLNDISEFMKLLKQIYAQWYNKNFERSGYFWGSRFKSIIIQPGIHLLNCAIYIILNPVRAKMVTSPEKYKFSSFYINKHKYKFVKYSENYRKFHKKIENFFKGKIMGEKKFINMVENLIKKKRQKTIT